MEDDPDYHPYRDELDDHVTESMKDPLYKTAVLSKTGLLPGDLLLTRSKSGPGWWIRLGAAFQDKPNLVNHVIIAHHIDKAGIYWGIEGRPGGVGWVPNIERFFENPYTMDNREQVKSDTQRRYICDEAQALVGTPYDWMAIAGDGLDALSLPNPWDKLWEEGKPSHVVCSSAADYIYQGSGLLSPDEDQNCKPADWAELWIAKGWA